MAVTLAQAQNLSQDKLTSFVIDEFRKSALLDVMQFDNTVKPVGSAMRYSYNRVSTLPTAAPRLLNAEYIAQEAATTPVTVDLSIFGGSFQIDRALQANERQVIDLVQFQLAQKSQATVAEFHHQFINGSVAAGVGAFDGLDALLTGGAQELTPTAPIALTTSANIDSNWKVFTDHMRKLRALLDGAPTLYLMNLDMFAVFQSVMDRAGVNLLSKANYGDEVLQWGNSMVMAMGDRTGTTNPIIATSGAGLTSIYAVRLGLDGVHGVSPDGGTVIKTYLPDMMLPGAVKTGEVEMIAAIAIKATKSCAVLRSIDIVA
jgi:hypothetical protein